MTAPFFFGARCKRGRHFYTTTAPSCCIPASYCHLSVTLQTMRIIVVNLQGNRAAFRIFIVLLMYSFDSPSYIFSAISGEGVPLSIRTDTTLHFTYEVRTMWSCLTCLRSLNMLPFKRYILKYQFLQEDLLQKCVICTLFMPAPLSLL